MFTILLMFFEHVHKHMTPRSIFYPKPEIKCTGINTANLQFCPTCKTGFKLAICKLRFLDRIYLSQITLRSFCEIRKSIFPSVRIFIFRETTKFLFTLQARQIAYILLQKVFYSKNFSCIWVAFWSQTPNGGLQHSPIPSNCWNFSLNLYGSLLKR